MNNLTAENLRQIHLMLMHDPRLPESKLHDHPLSFHTDKMAANTEKNNKLWEAYTATYLTPDEKKLAEDYQAKRKVYQDTRKKTLDLIHAGKYAEANSSLVLETGPAYMANRDALQKLLDLQIGIAKDEYDKAVQAYGVTRNISIGAIVVGVLLGLLVGVLLIRSLGRSLGQAMEVAGKIAEGDLDSTIKVTSHDEVGLLLTSMDAMQTALKRIVGDVQRIVEAANKGDFSIKLDTTAHKGFAKEIATELNQLSDTVDTAFDDTIRVAKALAEGDLSQKVTRDYQGAYNVVKQSVNTTADSLTKIVAEIKNIVEAAALRGDFGVKMDLNGKMGYTKDLAALLNQLSDVSETALNDVTRVAQALANGDLSQKITKDYAGPVRSDQGRR